MASLEPEVYAIVHIRPSFISTLIAPDTILASDITQRLVPESFSNKDITPVAITSNLKPVVISTEEV